MRRAGVKVLSEANDIAERLVDDYPLRDQWADWCRPYNPCPRCRRTTPSADLMRRQMGRGLEIARLVAEAS